jgi:hypothetical protein
MLLLTWLYRLLLLFESTNRSDLLREYLPLESNHNHYSMRIGLLDEAPMSPVRPQIEIHLGNGVGGGLNWSHRLCSHCQDW